MGVARILDELDAATAAADQARIRGALDQIVCAPRAFDALCITFGVDDAGAGDAGASVGATLLPEVAALQMPEVPGARHKDTLIHSFKVVARAPRRPLVRWAALLHDVGKPSTRRITGTKVEFHNHEVVSRRLARRRLVELGYDTGFAAAVGDVIVVAGKVASYEADLWTDSSVRRLITEAGPLLDEACWMARADCTSRYPDRRRAAAARVDAFVAHAATVTARDTAAKRRPLLDGRTVMDLLGLDPGPEIAVVLAHLLAAEDAGRIATVADATELVRADGPGLLAAT